MKTVILAGGFGTRLGTLTEVVPKPMVMIENKPIVWHVMKTYAYYGYNEFVIATGYKGDVIKNYFFLYNTFNKNFTVDLKNGDITFLGDNNNEEWKVTIVDTGLNTLKGGRLKRIQPFLEDQTNMLSYGDGLCDVDINDLIRFHKSHKKILTITGVHPPSHFGEIYDNDNQIISFKEKAQSRRGLINGGYMVFEKELFDYLSDDENCEFETDALEELVAKEQVMVYKHNGNWACMDSKRDLDNLTDLLRTDKAFWKKW
jgi:glucose-1-phosphate cytidylyltransferase